MMHRGFLVVALALVAVLSPVGAGRAAGDVVPGADLGVVSNVATAHDVAGGREVVFTVVATNHGPDAVGMDVNLTPDANFGASCDRGITHDGNTACEYGLVQPGESVTQTYTSLAPVSNSDIARETACVSSESSNNDPDPSNDCLTAESDPPPPDADLAVVSNVASTSRVTGGRQVVFTVVATNNGPDPVGMDVNLTPDANFVASCDRGITHDGNTACEYSLVQPGDSVTQTYTSVSPIAESEVASETACVSSESQINDSNPDNDCQTAESGPPLPDADLAVVSNTARTYKVAGGRRVVFTVVATNHGPDAAEMNVTFSLPTTSFDVTCDHGVTPDTPSCEYSVIEPGESVTQTYATPTVPARSVVSGKACVSSDVGVNDSVAANTCLTARSQSSAPTPSTPTHLRFGVHGGQVHLTWDRSADPYFSYFAVRRSRQSDESRTSLWTRLKPNFVTPQAIDTLGTGTYYYYVTEINTSGDVSARSNEIAVRVGRPQPPKPPYLSIASAAKRVPLVLAHAYGTAFRHGPGYRETCVRESRNVVDCAVKWKTKRYRYHGTVRISRTSAWHTNIHVRRTRR